MILFFFNFYFFNKHFWFPLPVRFLLLKSLKIFTLGKVLQFSADHHAGWPLCKVWEHRFTVPDLVSSPPPTPWFTLQWSLLDTKEAFVGVGSGDRSKSSLGSFVHNALWKKRVSRQHTTSTSSQNGLLALWNEQGIAAKEGLRFFSLPSKCLLHLNNSKIFRWFPVMFCHAGPGPDR